MASSGNSEGHRNPDERAISSAVRGKRILITGAGGFVGSALVRALSELLVEQLILLDIAEAGLHELSLQMDDNLEVPCGLVVGDICDRDHLLHLFERYRPHLVFHAAACKHVSLMEQNPFAAARTNVLGSQQVISAASSFGAEQVIVISTDKAVDPTSIMGATKRIVELMVLANRDATRMKAVRLGNVFASTGSVVPILREQIARGGPITITDPACERYFVSIDEAVCWLLLSCLTEHSAAVLVPRTEEPRRILDLAHELMANARMDERELEYRFIGLRAGEKLIERLISNEEIVHDSSIAILRRVETENLLSAEKLYRAIAEIAAAVSAKDLEQLLNAIASIVPGYRPSKYLQHELEHTKSAQA